MIVTVQPVLRQYTREKNKSPNTHCALASNCALQESEILGRFARAKAFVA